MSLKVRTTSLTKLRLQQNQPFVDDHLARMLEVDCNLARNTGLNLPQPPVGLGRVPHQHSGFKD